MKKILLSLLTVSAVVLVACGPSATFTAVEKASSDAMAQLDTVTAPASVSTVIATYSAAVTEVTANGELKGEEQTKAAELEAALIAKATTISDSLTQIMIQQMVVISDSNAVVVEETVVETK